MNEKKTAVLNVRIAPSLRARVDAVERKHGVTMAAQLEDAITALCDAVEREGRYVRPLCLLMATESAALAAEGPQAAYGVGACATEKPRR